MYIYMCVYMCVYISVHTYIHMAVLLHRSNSQTPGSIRNKFKISFIGFIWKCLSMILCESSDTSCNWLKFMWAIKKQLADIGKIFCEKLFIINTRSVT